jgi:hypothetical protein
MTPFETLEKTIRQMRHDFLALRLDPPSEITLSGWTWDAVRHSAPIYYSAPINVDGPTVCGVKINIS